MPELTELQDPRWFEPIVAENVRRKLQGEPRQSIIDSEVAYVIELETVAAQQLDATQKANAEFYRFLPSKYLDSLGGNLGWPKPSSIPKMPR